ncbi:MAG: cyclic pyranopterin monophosphate synthase MoaC [Deltaproteobacteria bacterium]|jgi:cyclic pyranopterin monophosphate synthase|nr:cyclic pyranopterin monophosphate synthase MoaC [Deltaproteobacteria bacterium]MBT6435865.1 cyclic pyranopterin monophosphate synthase MoaC [Deltaproteobacteria bacterium]MBT6490265.1 cyclic pyranopterin monophosphate synthase MoaC [Deltaproteobacteria bacterium]
MASSKKSKLTHLNQRGEMHMVDIGQKQVTSRQAVAQSRLRLNKASIEALKNGADKGDVFAAARLAGIMAAKKTSELIPLCHPLGLTRVDVEVELKPPHVEILVVAENAGKTGVEMEAMTAASIAALTVYDMLKAVDRGMTIERVRLIKKTGGKSGEWKRRGR